MSSQALGMFSIKSKASGYFSAKLASYGAKMGYGQANAAGIDF